MKEKIKKYVKIAAIVLVLVLYGYFFIYQQLHENNILKSREADLLAENQRIEKEIKSLLDRASLIEILNAEIQDLENNLNHDLTDGANLVLFFEKMMQQNVVLGEYITNPTQEFSTFRALPLELRMAGNYRAVMNILHYLEYQPNMTQLQDVFIRAFNYPEDVERYVVKEEDLTNLSEWVLVERDPATVLPGESPFEEVLITREIEVSLNELFKGYVVAEFTLVFYTTPDPEAKVHLDSVRDWPVSNPNPFIQ